MKVCVPALQAVVPRAAQEIRKGGWHETKTIPQDDLADVEDVEFFLKEYAIAKAYSGWTREAAIWDANMLGGHLFYMINFELHHRKAFWVDEALAWMLSQTRLDIDGECLKLPFPSCAFLYTDRATLELGEEILRNEEDALIKGERLKIISVYLVQGPGEGDATGLSVNCLLDSQTGKWPYMLTRDLLIGPRDNLDTILDSHFSGIDVDTLDAVFSSPPFKRLVHLVINSILYATSSHLERLVLQAPFKSVKRGAKRRAEKIARKQKEYTTDDVFHLPGKIDITQVRHLRNLLREDSGRQIMKRFMVRGHWRKANPSWKDQRLRWVEPFWKGPEIAMVIEKEYRMKP